MKDISSLRVAGQIVLVVLVLALLLASCGTGEASPRLRITNSGAEPIDDLVVLFPGEEVAFGDVAPGETTEYKAVGEGVYRYAAYRFQVDGQEITQPVIDWVGEEPVQGDAFTYVLDYDPAREPIQQIWLVQAIQDE